MENMTGYISGRLSLKRNLPRKVDVPVPAQLIEDNFITPLVRWGRSENVVGAPRNQKQLTEDETSLGAEVKRFSSPTPSSSANLVSSASSALFEMDIANVTGNMGNKVEYPLSPIEEETESPESSTDNSPDSAANSVTSYSGKSTSDFRDYDTNGFDLRGISEEECVSDVVQYGRYRTTTCSPSSTSTFVTRNKLAEDDCQIRKTCSDENIQICPGDSRVDMYRKSHAVSKLKDAVDSLKYKFLKSERNAIDMEKKLLLERTTCRHLIEEYVEKCLKENEAMKVDFQAWKESIADKIMINILQWQMEERERINNEIAKFSHFYYKEIEKKLIKMSRDWQMEESKKMINYVRKEKDREDSREENMRVFYENVQSQLENLEKRNKNSYMNFRNQIDVWESRLREEVVKLHEGNLKALFSQVKARPTCSQGCFEQIETIFNERRKLSFDACSKHCLQKVQHKYPPLE